MHHCVKTLFATVLLLLVLFGRPAQAQTTSYTSVNVAPSISAYGQYVTIRATVRPYCTGCPAPQPTGSVDFLVDGVLSFTSPVGSPSIGIAITNALSVGNHSIIATYSGDPNNAGSTSAESTLVVVPAATTTTIAPHGPLPLGQSLNVSVSVGVQQPGVGTPTGNVLVSDGVGDTCTIVLPASSCVLTPSVPGALTLVARYPGDANLNPSNGVSSLTVGASAHTVGGTIGGLGGDGFVLHLQHAGGTEDLPVPAGSTTFAFSAPVAYGSFYNVSVATQPVNPHQTCAVANGAGTMPASDVATVAVSCTTDTYSVGGSVSGLVGSGLVVQINGGGDLAIAANGSYAFPGVADGSGYTVTVSAQPTAPPQICTLTNGQGSVHGANVTNVAITCAGLHTVGGVVGNLHGALVLQLNGGNDLQVIPGNPSPFTFATLLADGSAYTVTVAQQPPGQSCTPFNASGTVAGADVTGVFVQCQDDNPAQLVLTVDDGRDFASYGQMLQYVVKLTNVGGSPASGIQVSGMFGPALDGDHAQWQCTSEGGASCSPGGSGALFDSATIPPGGTATWIVQASVLDTTDFATSEFTVSAGSVVSDVDTLVLFRDGLDD